MEQDIGFQFKQIHDAFEAHVNHIVGKYDLTFSQMLVLKYLMENYEKEVNLRDIERHLNLKHPTVVGILKRMEIKELIEITVNPKDRRSRIILLTGKAKKLDEHLGKEMRRFKQEMEVKLVRGFSDEERKILGSLLSRVLNNLCISDQ